MFCTSQMAESLSMFFSFLCHIYLVQIIMSILFLRHEIAVTFSTDFVLSGANDLPNSNSTPQRRERQHNETSNCQPPPFFLINDVTIVVSPSGEKIKSCQR